MRSVEAQACGPDELLASEADRRSLAEVLASIVVAAERGGDRLRCCGNALLCGWRMLGEAFQVDRGAAEQELYVEGGCAATADAVEERHQRVALVTLRPLAETAGDTALLR